MPVFRNKRSFAKKIAKGELDCYQLEGEEKELLLNFLESHRMPYDTIFIKNGTFKTHISRPTIVSFKEDWSIGAMQGTFIAVSNDGGANSVKVKRPLDVQDMEMYCHLQDDKEGRPLCLTFDIVYDDIEVNVLLEGAFNLERFLGFGFAEEP